MSGLVNDRGLQVLAGTPSGAGGEAINTNFKELVKWNPQCDWTATTDPTVDDDETLDFYAGSFWLNTSSNEMFVCVDAADGAADWRAVPVGSFQSKRRSSTLTLNSTTLVSTDLTFDVKDGETWRFEVNLFATSLDAAADLQCRVNGPGNGYFSFVNVEIAQVKSASLNTQTTVLSVNNGTDDLIQINGIVEATSDGTVDPRIRNGSGTTPQTFNEWSYVTAQRVS